MQLLTNSGWSPSNTIESIFVQIHCEMLTGKIIIFNADNDTSFIDSAQGDEEVYYVINEWLEEHVSPCLYGIGNTIWEAFEDYKKRLRTNYEKNK